MIIIYKVMVKQKNKKLHLAMYIVSQSKQLSITYLKKNKHISTEMSYDQISGSHNYACNAY